MAEVLKNDWKDITGEEFEKPYYQQLKQFLIKEYKSTAIFPDMYHIYEALNLTSYKNVKVVILGQDPYHGVGQAHGLCFSVQPSVKTPPSLVNIYKELQEDLGCYIPDNGFLEKWANQGVLLLNTVLTVRAHQAFSHRNMGWESFTDNVIKNLNKREEPIVFLLWGSPARKKKALITNKHHVILESAHPSPLSAYRGFFGCKHFSKTNDFLTSMNKEPIDWQIENL